MTRREAARAPAPRAHVLAGRSRGTPPSQTTHPPHNIALAAGTVSHHCLHKSRGEHAALEAWRCAEATATRTSASQTFDFIGATSRLVGCFLRDRASGPSPCAQPHRLLVCLRFLVCQCVSAPASVAPRALVELRSGCLRCPGPRWPLSELFGLRVAAVAATVRRRIGGRGSSRA